MGKTSIQQTSTLTPSKERTLKDDGTGDDGWRVVLLRALIQGNLDLVSSTLLAHIDVLSLPFTSAMPVWKLQWETLHWWLLRDATPLFLASVFAHPPLVQWLLAHGADRETRCYLKRTALEMVGECCETTVDERISKTHLTDRVALCRQLLTDAPSLPAPPTENVQFESHVSTQVVVVNRQQQQTLYKCVMDTTWLTPLSNGAIIEKYEVRYRLLAEDMDGDDDDASSSSTGNWRVERATHNRRSRKQGLVLDGLQFASRYEFMLRSWNAAGKGEWGRTYKVRTVESPEMTQQQQ